MRYFLLRCCATNVVFIAAVLHQATAQASASGCPRGLSQPYYVFAGSCFQFVAIEKTWVNARSHCEQQAAGKLVTIPNMTTQMWIITQIASLGWPNNGVWIGMHDRPTEGRYYWADYHGDTPATFFNWAPGEPNNRFDQDCVYMRRQYGWKWVDVECNSPIMRKYNFVCQYRLTSQPTTMVPYATRLPSTSIPASSRQIALNVETSSFPAFGRQTNVLHATDIATTASAEPGAKGLTQRASSAAVSSRPQQDSSFSTVAVLLNDVFTSRRNKGLTSLPTASAPFATRLALTSASTPTTARTNDRQTVPNFEISGSSAFTMQRFLPLTRDYAATAVMEPYNNTWSSINGVAVISREQYGERFRTAPLASLVPGSSATTTYQNEQPTSRNNALTRVSTLQTTERSWTPTVTAGENWPPRSSLSIFARDWTADLSGSSVSVTMSTVNASANGVNASGLTTGFEIIPPSPGSFSTDTVSPTTLLSSTDINRGVPSRHATYPGSATQAKPSTMPQRGVQVSPTAASTPSATAQESASGCPRGLSQPYYVFAGSCFQFVAIEKTWVNARSHCGRQAEGKLATIPNMATQIWITTQIARLGWSNNGVWIGMHDRLREGRYYWADYNVDIPATFFNWASGEPDNRYNQDCVQMRRQSEWKWVDAECDSPRFRTYNFICQYRLTSLSTTMVPYVSRLPPTSTPASSRQTVLNAINSSFPASGRQITALHTHDIEMTASTEPGTKGSTQRASSAAVSSRPQQDSSFSTVAILSSKASSVATNPYLNEVFTSGRNEAMTRVSTLQTTERSWTPTGTAGENLPFRSSLLISTRDWTADLRRSSVSVTMSTVNVSADSVNASGLTTGFEIILTSSGSFPLDTASPTTLRSSTDINRIVPSRHATYPGTPVQAEPSEMPQGSVQVSLMAVSTPSATGKTSSKPATPWSLPTEEDDSLGPGIATSATNLKTGAATETMLLSTSEYGSKSVLSEVPCTSVDGGTSVQPLPSAAPSANFNPDDITTIVGQPKQYSLEDPEKHEASLSLYVGVGAGVSLLLLLIGPALLFLLLKKKRLPRPSCAVESLQLSIENPMYTTLEANEDVSHLKMLGAAETHVGTASLMGIDTEGHPLLISW